jgi:hypothetical protein
MPDESENGELTYSRHSARSTAEPLRKFMAESGLDAHKTAEAMGVTVGGIRGWLKNNDMPKLAAVAVEGLSRRLPRSRSSIYVLACPPDKMEALESVAKAIGVELTRLKMDP